MNRRQVLSGGVGVPTSACITWGVIESFLRREPLIVERSFRNRSGDAASLGITFLGCRVAVHRGEDLAMHELPQSLRIILQHIHNVEKGSRNN